MTVQLFRRKADKVSVYAERLERDIEDFHVDVWVVYSQSADGAPIDSELVSHEDFVDQYATLIVIKKGIDTREGFGKI